MPRLILASLAVGLPVLMGSMAYGAVAPTDATTTNSTSTNAAAPADTKTSTTAAPAATSTPDEANEPLQEVVVTGLKASLEKALDDKKNSGVVQDSIDAEELGRFPDADVADSLEHLPGVTITRTTGGEGETVSVRGFGKQYNIVTLNGRIMATDDDSRDLAFDVLPSEVIAGADVLKSSEASALEGSIGGTVNLRTASPFTNPGLHGGVHAEGNYDDMSELYGKKFSAFISNTFFDNTLGFLLGGVYSDQKTRTDSLNAYTQNIYGPTNYPFADASGGTPISVSPCCITFGSIFDEKKREAVSGSLEWHPTDTFSLILDGLWTKLEDDQLGYNQSYYFAYTTDGAGNPTWTNPTINNGLVTAVTSDDFTPEIVNNSVNRNVVTSLYGLRGSWDVTDRFKLKFDGYRSTASRPEGGSDSFVTAGLVSNTPTAQDLITVTDTRNGFPNLNVMVPPSQIGLSACPGSTASKTAAGYCSYTALMNGGYLNNNNYWSTHYDGLNGYSVHDQVTGFTLDGDFKVGLGPWDKLLFGAGYNHREKERQDIDNDWNNGSGEYGTLYNTAGCPVQCNPYSFGSQGFNVISMGSVPNFMSGAGGSFPGVLPRLNVAQLLNFLKSLNGKTNPFYCTGATYDTCAPVTPFDYNSFLPTVNPFNSYDVIEKTFNFYTEAVFHGDNWSGNLGVRLVHTQTTANTSQSVPSAIWTSSVANATQTYNLIYATGTPFNETDSYTMALPSANFAYWLIPNQLQTRAAVGETMSRPDLNQLAPNSTNLASNGENQLYYTGVAGLKPIKAWNGDLDLEWYYAPHSAVTGGVFYKKVLNDIYNSATSNVNLGTTQYIGGPPGTVAGTPFLWTVYAPANGQQETFKGVEFTWQHFLENGLGTHVELTHTWEAATIANAAPPTTASVSLIYAKGPINADVTWDYTSHYNSYCSECTEVPGWPAVSDSFSWLTASVHYAVLPGMDVYWEGKNLLNSIARTYLDGNPLLPWAPGQQVGQSASGTGYGYSAYGRIFVVGVSYKF